MILMLLSLHSVMQKILWLVLNVNVQMPLEQLCRQLFLCGDEINKRHMKSKVSILLGIN